MDRDNGCPSSCTKNGVLEGRIKIEVLSAPNAALQVTNKSFCEGGNTQIKYTGNQNISLTPIGGTGTCNISGSGSSSLTLNGCSPGTYNVDVQVTNDAGCKATKTVSFTVFDAPTADAGPDLNFCEGNIPKGACLGGNPTGSGGTGPYSYLWSGDINALAGLFPIFDPNPCLDPTLSPGTYNLQVTVTDANGCSASDLVTVNIGQRPNLSLGPIIKLSNQKLCKGTVVPHYFFFNASPQANVSISPSSTGIVNCGGIFGCVGIVWPSSTTTYTVTATSPSGCTTKKSFTINFKECECKGHQAKGNWKLGSNNNDPLATNASNNAPASSEDLTIDGTFTINVNQFTLSGNNVRMIGHDASGGTADPTEIIVPDGNTLVIENGAALFACDEMWQGITVKGGGELIVKGNGKVQDAVDGITLKNGPNGDNASLLELKNARLNKNIDHLVVDPYDEPQLNASNPHPAVIHGTAFTCDDPLLPNDDSKNYTDHGIWTHSLQNSNNIFTDGLVVGDPAESENHFDNMKIGIFARASSFKVQNSKFTDIDRPSGGTSCGNSVSPCTGIAIWGTGNEYMRATIGGGSSAAGNSFEDVYHAADIFGFQEVRIRENTVDNPAGSNPNLTGVRGFLVQQSNLERWDVRIERNTIRDNRIGIKMLNLDPGRAYWRLGINDNVISNPEAHINDAILVENANLVGPVLAWNITDNIISSSKLGIRVMNAAGPIYVRENEIDLQTVNNQAVGIQYKGGSTILTRENLIRGKNTSSGFHGIEAIEGQAHKFICNRIETVREGIRYEMNYPLGDIINSNEFSDFYRGITLNNSSNIVDQGDPNNASGNKMLTAPGDADTWTDNTSNKNPQATFYVNQSNNPDYPSINTGSPPIQITNTNASTFYSCPPQIPPVQEPTKEQVERIAGDSITYSYQTQASEWHADQSAYRSIKRDSTLSAQSSMIASYEDSLDKSAMGRIRDIDQALDQGNVSQAKSLKQNMSCTCPIESRYKEYFGVYLNSAAVDSSCSQAQRNTLWQIAKKCPLEHGNAVFRARVLLRADLDSNIRFDPNCGPKPSNKALDEENSGKSTGVADDKQSFEAASFEWRPNPTEGRTQLLYDLGGRQKGQLRVMNLQGRTVDTQTLEDDNGQTVLDFVDQGSGVYLYRITTGNKTLKTGRLVITD